MSSLTQTAIKASFLKLLNEKPFNKITVKDIVEDCQINRNSFYYHFNDIPSLLEEILLEQTGLILKEQDKSMSIYDCLIYAIDFALQNKKAVLHIYDSANRAFFEQYLNRVSESAVKDYLNNVFEQSLICDEDKDAIIMCFKCQLVGFVLDWLATGMKYDLCVKMKRICFLFEGSVENAIKRSKGE